MSGFGWALLAAVIWGCCPLIEKLGLVRADPMIGVFARSFGVLLGLVVFGWRASVWKGLTDLSVRSFTLLALGGFLASFLGQLAFYQALKTGRISQVTPVAGSYPLVAAVLGWLVLSEPITAARLAGVACVVVGILLLKP